ncbi:MULTISPECIES: hypothetical protein [unclassified Polaromonas]|uniref:hypothetical protein n=1 Tax=unclassified Polaromonas TaxID=2638319 RepID=UPI0018C99852|nr:MULTISPECIES: hypothetical protein [unclassified Polaromonas]MBG6070788.1 hypothetical protein [Polaromonas sp. CG_9.7]MBG6112903.1 hypothetical protein [Polaromonas sp. CG_9.2]MDH6186376.1 hypothetical protein [Polaromonas sp. CG_23.6]
MYTNLSATSAADFLKDAEAVVSGVNSKVRASCVASCFVKTRKFTKGEPAGLPHNRVHCPDMQRKAFSFFVNTPKKGLQ